MLEVDDFVIDKKHGITGFIKEVYSDWQDLKSKNYFATIDPDNESDKMDYVEKIIKGDPKDKWLELQEIPFTDENLSERWYSVESSSGGCIWTCESFLMAVFWENTSSEFESHVFQVSAKLGLLKSRCVFGTTDLN